MFSTFDRTGTPQKAGSTCRRLSDSSSTFSGKCGPLYGVLRHTLSPVNTVKGDDLLQLRSTQLPPSVEWETSITYRATECRPRWLTGAVVCLPAAPRVQFFAETGNEWPHSALRYHQLMPITSDSVKRSSAIATFIFRYYEFTFLSCACQLS